MLEFLWRFQLWRLSVVWLMGKGWLPDWFVFRSGAVHALRDLFLRQGHFDLAAGASAWLREHGG